MIIKKARFVTSISLASKYGAAVEGLPGSEICVVGRSNVGKSSFINFLARQNKLAKTSSTPGRTRLINLFSFNDGEFTLVDLPGYGYAAASKSEKYKWDTLIGGYLENSRKLVRALVLVDCRREPSVLDRQMVDYLYSYGIPFSVIDTKADKLTRNQLFGSIQKIATALAVGRDNIIAVSAVSGKGRDEVLAHLEEVLRSASETENE